MRCSGGLLADELVRSHGVRLVGLSNEWFCYLVEGFVVVGWVGGREGGGVWSA